MTPRRPTTFRIVSAALIGTVLLSAHSVAQTPAQPLATVGQPATTAPALSTSKPDAAPPAATADTAPMTMDRFLDRLMIAESGGRLDARNPRSTALGPFQFIESTFLAVARRHFPDETAKLAPAQVLALRTDLAFSRKAAEAFTRDNAVVLQANELQPSYPNLRLAFLLGAGGAIRVLRAPPETPLSAVLPPAVLIANPFMVTMTARSLIARSAREVLQPVTSTAGVEVPPGSVVPPGARQSAGPRIAVRCNLRLPSCKRWLALHQSKQLPARRGGTRIATVTRLQPAPQLVPLTADRAPVRAPSRGLVRTAGRRR